MPRTPKLIKIADGLVPVGTPVFLYHERFCRFEMEIAGELNCLDSDYYITGRRALVAAQQRITDRYSDFLGKTTK